LAYNKFYLDEIYNYLTVMPLSKLSRFFISTLDPKVFDGFVESIARLVMTSGRKTRLIQTGNVGFYLFAMVISIIVILVFSVYFTFIK
jgi:NADH-quinone oxidoreductase subunit L